MGRYGVARFVHLRQHLVEPPQRSVQMHFNPTRSAGDVVTVIFHSPAFHERYADRAHFGQLEHGLKPVFHGLRQQVGEIPVVEYAQRKTLRDFAYGGRQETVAQIAVLRLYEYRIFRQTLDEHLAAHIMQFDTCTIT